MLTGGIDTPVVGYGGGLPAGIMLGGSEFIGGGGAIWGGACTLLTGIATLPSIRLPPSKLDGDLPTFQSAVAPSARLRNALSERGGIDSIAGGGAIMLGSSGLNFATVGFVGGVARAVGDTIRNFGSVTPNVDTGMFGAGVRAGWPPWDAALGNCGGGGPIAVRLGPPGP